MIRPSAAGGVFDYGTVDLAPPGSASASLCGVSGRWSEWDPARVLSSHTLVDPGLSHIVYTFCDARQGIFPPGKANLPSEVGTCRLGSPNGVHNVRQEPLFSLSDTAGCTPFETATTSRGIFPRSTLNSPCVGTPGCNEDQAASHRLYLSEIVETPGGYSTPESPRSEMTCPSRKPPSLHVLNNPQGAPLGVQNVGRPGAGKLDLREAR